MRRLTLLLLLSLAACGATPPELEARLIEVEVQLSRLEARLDAMAPHAERLSALEAALAMPTQDDRLLTRVLDLEARLLELQSRLDGQPAPAPQPDPEPGRIIQVGPAPPGVERAAPKPGLPVKVVATGSGGLILVEDADTGQLVRIELLGVLPPQRSDDYDAFPGLRQQFEEALGEAKAGSDAPFEASQQHLEALLAEATVTLEYPGGSASRSPSGAVNAYVTAQRGSERLDVNAAMLRDGYALAAPRHGRYRDYAALEREAKAEGRGLFAE
jgi:endonuclease YncB( thermonuclease family)